MVLNLPLNLQKSRSSSVLEFCTVETMPLGMNHYFSNGGGGTIFQRLGHNFFLNFSLSKQFFSEILVRQTIYFFNLLKSNNFFLPWVILVSMELKVI